MTLNISSSQQQKAISRREIEILRLMSMGYSSKEIGTELFISEYTVHTHRKNMVRKLGLRNSHQLIAWGFKEMIFSF